MVTLLLALALAQILAIGGAETTSSTSTTKQPPHIICIMSDDMGFNDVGFHGSNQIPTPNIDALATFGIALNRYYVAPMCTPSRSSLLSGKYPSNVGMQHFVIPSDQPWGLGLKEKLLPEYMREGGYRTHIVGKWHLGLYMKRYTPTERGFDSHFGYLGPYIDYYNHSLSQSNMEDPTDSGYDMRRNHSLHYASKGTYATDLFSDVAVETIANHPKHLPLFMYLAHLAPHTANGNDPMQVPADELRKFEYIVDPKRRHYAAMVSRLDAGIGRVVDALRVHNMLENSVVLFFSDNGAPTVGQHSNAGSNYPFKGQKDTPWEGAVRSAGAIWSPLLRKRQRVSNQLFHISDWLPTFAHLAGVPVQQPIDGQNIWDALSSDTTSPRHEVLCNLDELTGYSSLVHNEWKYVNGSTNDGKYDYWISDAPDPAERHPSFEHYGISVLSSATGKALQPFSFDAGASKEATMSPEQIEKLRSQAVIECGQVPLPLPDEEQFQCKPLLAPCLFNVITDPCERRNLAALRPSVLRAMSAGVEVFRKSAVKPRNQPADDRSNPKHFNGTWTWWYDELHIPDHSGAGHLSSCTTLLMILVAIWGQYNVWQ